MEAYEKLIKRFAGFLAVVAAALMVSGIVWPVAYYAKSETNQRIIAEQTQVIQQITAQRNQLAQIINNAQEAAKKAKAPEQPSEVDK